MRGTSLPDRLLSKRLIFCLTNGRSGSYTLARLFRCVEVVDGHHEPHPKFSDVMRDVQHRPELAIRFLLEQKLPEISKSPKTVYVETSHLVSKGFFEPLLEIGTKPSFIVLRRDPRAIALSLLRIGAIPGRNRRGLKWLLKPTDPVLVQLPDRPDLTDYQLCYWHALETEARQECYRCKAQRNGLTVVETDIDRLNEPGAFESLCDSLGLQITIEDRARIQDLRGLTFNLKTSSAPYSAPPRDPAGEELEVRSLISSATPLASMADYHAAADAPRRPRWARKTP